MFLCILGPKNSPQGSGGWSCAPLGKGGWLTAAAFPQTPAINAQGDRPSKAPLEMRNITILLL